MFYINTSNQTLKKHSNIASFYIPKSGKTAPSFKIGLNKHISETIDVVQDVSDGITAINIESISNKYINGVQIDGMGYTRSESLVTLKEGEYYINLETKQLIVATYKYQKAKVNIKIQIDNVPLLHNEVTNIPEILQRDYVIGSLNITRNFKDHPSASISIVVSGKDVDAIIDEFCTKDKKYVFYNIPFRVVDGGITQQVYKVSEYPFGYHQINISFEGWWKELLEEPVFWKDNYNSKTKNVDECYPGSKYLAERMALDPEFAKKFPLTASLYQRTTYNNPAKESGISKPGMQSILLSHLANKVQVPLITAKSLFTEYSKDIENRATTTLQSEITKVCEENNLVPIYSKPDGIHFVKWDQGYPHNLKQEEIITELSISRTSCNNDGLKPIRISWADYNPNNVFFNKKPRFKQIDRPESMTLEPSDHSAKRPPDHYRNIDEISMVFDASGERRTETIKWFKGTTVMKETINEYGVEVLAVQIYNPDTGKLQGSAGAFWRHIKQLNKYHIYDYRTGYYLGHRLTGWNRGRFKVESDALETVWLTEEAKSPDLDDTERAIALAELATYFFRSIPINGYEYYTLSQYRDYYRPRNAKDRHEENMRPFIVYEECVENGKVLPKDGLDLSGTGMNLIQQIESQLIEKSAVIVPKAVEDLTYVEPMFIRRVVNTYGGKATIPNPYNMSLADEEKPQPPLTTGEDRYERSDVRIFKSKNTRNDRIGNPSIPRLVIDTKGNDSQLEDKYLTRTHSNSAQDASFARSAQTTGETISNGRPPAATTVGTPYVTMEEYLKEHSNPVLTITENWGDYKTFLDKWYMYIYTDPYTEDSPPSSTSWSFNAYTREKALEMAKTRYLMELYEQQDRYSFTSLFKPEYIEGDFLSFDFEFKYYTTKIMSINHTIDIQGKEITENRQVYTGSSNLSLLHFPPKNIRDLKNFKAPKEDDYLKYLKVSKIYHRGFELGSTSNNFSFRRRGL